MALPMLAMTSDLIWILLLCSLLASAAGYAIRKNRQDKSERPLTVKETGKLIERIHEQTGIDPSKPTAIVIEPPSNEK